MSIFWLFHCISCVLFSIASSVLLEGVIVLCGLWLLFSLVGWFSLSPVSIVFPVLVLFCPLLDWDRFLATWISWVGGGFWQGLLLRRASGMPPSWTFPLVASGTGWYWGRVSYAAFALANSSLLVGHWRFHASCSPRHVAHFLGTFRSAFDGQYLESCSCAQ